MSDKMNRETFIKELSTLNITPTKEQLQSLETYKNLLQEYNQKFNLTAIIQDEDIYLKHFYDCLTLKKALDLTQDLKVLDIGTGAGFPGLVLKIFFPNLKITLVEANAKKVLFLNTVIKTLELKDIECLNMRAENLPPEYLEYFDIVTSRAVAKTNILMELAIPYLKINGLFVPLKANIDQELEESQNALKVLNCCLLKKCEFNLPLINAKRTILLIQKNAKTSSQYPRTYDKIIKKPL